MKSTKAIILSIVIIGILIVGWIAFQNNDKRIFAKSDASNAYTQAVAGDAESQMIIARYYFIGSIVDKDEAKGAEWTEKAAQSGYAPAISLMGVLYMGGIGVPQDLNAAQEWLSKSEDTQAQDLGAYLKKLNENVAKLPEEQRKKVIADNNEAAAKDVQESFKGIVAQLEQLSEQDTRAMSEEKAANDNVSDENSTDTEEETETETDIETEAVGE